MHGRILSQKWQESSLGVGDSKLTSQSVCVDSIVIQGEGPKVSITRANFKHLVSPWSRSCHSPCYVVSIHTYVIWRTKVVHGSTQGGPAMVFYGPFVKSQLFHPLFENAWPDFNQTWQESSLGAGDSKLFIWYIRLLWEAQGDGPKGQNFSNYELRSPNAVYVEPVVKLCKVSLGEESRLLVAIHRVAPM